MKRKLALLLASVMAFSALPMTAYAATKGTMTSTPNNAPKYSLLYENDLTGKAGTFDSKLDLDGLEYFQKGGYLKITVSDTIPAGGSINLELTNGEFFFKQLDDVASPTINPSTATGIGSRNPSSATGVSYVTKTATWVDNAGVIQLATNSEVTTSGTYALPSGHVPPTSATKEYFIFPVLTVPAIVDALERTGTSQDTSDDDYVSVTGVMGTAVQYDGTKADKELKIAGITPPPGTVLFNAEAVPTKKSSKDMSSRWTADAAEAVFGDRKAATYNTNNGIYLESSMTYVRYGKYDTSGTVNHYSDAPYVMQMSSNSYKSATLMVTDELKDGDEILVPMVVRTTSDQDVSVLITGNNVSRNNYIVANSSSGKTKVTTTVETGRTEFELGSIKIAESRLASIKDGSGFTLTAPKGYYFDAKKLEVHTNLGIRWSGRGSAGLGTAGTDYKMSLSKDDTVLTIENLKIVPSDSNDTTGSIVLTKLVLLADNEDRVSDGKELSLTIKDVASTNESFTEETFKVAKVNDYGIKLELVDKKVPEFISGRLEGNVSINAAGVYSDNIDKDNHLAAKVKFSETAPNSWWAGHETVFSLPEDVTIMKAKISKIDKINEKTALLESGVGSGVSYNTRKTIGKVKVYDNEMTLNRLTVPTGDKASFEMELWLSIAVDFEGDIDLAVKGSTYKEDAAKVTIAKTIKPIEVKATVSDVQVGYQYFSVGDFEITETKAGNLLKDRYVNISVTDGISVDMNIANGFKWEISEGDIEIDKVTTRNILGVSNTTGSSEGQLSFRIKSESDKASTIKFSNVQVKVDRNVPYSNVSNSDDRGINIVVWGDAVANNYYGLHKGKAATSSADGINLNDTFDVPGISAKYINVTTIADPTQAQYKNVVKVTIGNPVIKINDVDFSMPVAAYISTASNSTMVPVRFIANALGLDENAVKWDDKARTVTVDATNRIIQFQIGNTNYLVNGVSVPMLSPDGLPVAAEINNERAFVPMRAIGEAFGITVGWDDATSTATYNAPVQK